MKVFGQTITETTRALQGPKQGTKGNDVFITRTQAIARIVITLLLLLFAFYLYDREGSTDKAQEFAAVIVGGVTGYWLR